MHPWIHTLAHTHQNTAGAFIIHGICETLTLCLVMKMGLLLLSMGAEGSTLIRKTNSTTQGPLNLGKSANSFYGICF